MTNTETAAKPNRAAAALAAMPAEFLDQHPRPLVRADHAAISAWLNGMRKGAEAAVTNFLAMATAAVNQGDTAGARLMLDEAKPYRDLMVALDNLAGADPLRRRPFGASPWTGQTMITKE